ncbi:MAG: amino acid adenylation domain-containing protein [Pseudomonadota bacterium]
MTEHLSDSDAPRSSAMQLLSSLQAMGIELSSHGAQLKVSARPGLINEEIKAAIGRNKTELLKLLERGDSAAPMVLSFFQERLWVLNRLDQQNPSYNIVATWLSPGPVDVAPFRTALQKLFSRHDVLRTIFADAKGTPSLRLVPAESVPLQLVDLRGQQTNDVRSRIQSDTEAAARRPFDLAHEPPVRTVIYQLDADRSVVLLTVHHIAADAWSMSLLGAEINSAFAGREPARNPVQYGNFARWQRRMHGMKSNAEAIEWWLQHLKNAPEFSLFLPDMPPAQQQTGASHGSSWSPQLSSAVRALCRQQGCTPYMMMLAALACVLHLHTAQADVVLGNPMGVREKQEYENVVGPFVNLLVMRFDLSGNPTFSQLMQRVRSVVLDAYEHREVPFESLLERRSPSRSQTHSPLFQMAVVLHNNPGENMPELISRGSMHELTWFARDTGECFEHNFEYRSDLYSTSLIAAVARQVQTILGAVVVNPDQQLSQLSLLDDDERFRVVEAFNDTARELERATFIEQFERQAATTPDAAAVSFDGNTLSYSSLNARAERLAHHLRVHGARPGVVLALCLERDLLLPISLLAVQKTGACYLPLDPGFPGERLTYMLEDCGPALLIGTADTLAEMVVPAHTRIVNLATVDFESPLPPHDDGKTQQRADPKDPAYVIYTSGSTGRPKGVVVSQEGLSNFVGSMAQEPGISRSDVLAAITTVAFDISALEFYLPWVRGGRVELVTKDVAQDGVALGAQLHAVGATVLQATPATWRLLEAAGWRPPPGFRALCGGEAMPRELADALLDRGVELWNLYGPTETTVWSTLQKVERSPAPIMVGRPISNTCVYIVDASGQPRPVGLPGEIWIGGAGVALGYHRRPELTAERFVPDHITGKQRQLYRTGDLGRWDHAGRVQHLGRIDNQIKIRGYRIETGEIEAVLAEHDAVKQAVVVAREAAPGDVRLVAYVLFEQGAELTVSEVRRHLRKLLPDYMVPSLVVVLDVIPLTPNGKIDRAALPDPFEQSVKAGTQREAPATGTEQLLAEVWRSVLQTGDIGAHDNFFDLGGHSLLTLRVVAELESRMGWRMDPRTLFFQTLRQIAAQVERHRPAETAET